MLMNFFNIGQAFFMQHFFEPHTYVLILCCCQQFQVASYCCCCYIPVPSCQLLLLLLYTSTKLLATAVVALYQYLVVSYCCCCYIPVPSCQLLLLLLYTSTELLATSVVACNTKFFCFYTVVAGNTKLFSYCCCCQFLVFSNSYIYQVLKNQFLKVLDPAIACTWGTVQAMTWALYRLQDRCSTLPKQRNFIYQIFIVIRARIVSGSPMVRLSANPL